MSAQVRPVGLAGRFTADEGTHFLSGVAALIRVPLVRMRLDQASGLATRGFVSGYPGSPLGGVDLELARRAELLAEHGIVHQPGLNEELAATAVFGSQVATVTRSFVGDGVLGMWYGKAPGLDRAADAIRHGNHAGTGVHSGVLVAVGDDPAAKSSTLPSASEGLCADLGLPVLHPGDPQEVLELGLHAIALSRTSGLWAALKMVSAVADGTATVDLSASPAPGMIEGGGVHRPVATLHQPHSAELERSLVEVRLPLAACYGQVHGLNRTTHGAPDAWLGVVASGHTYVALLEALRVLGIEPAECGRLGIRLLQVRMPYPMDPGQVRRFAEGLDEVLVVEEKAAFVERQVRDALYGTANAPVVVGKRSSEGEVLVPGWGALEADAIAEILRGRLGPRVDPARLRPWTTPMVEALAQTLDWALSNDPDVFLLGEDIIDPTGGAFGITKGLSTKYGRQRVRETPISEQAIIGAAIGAAMLGARPIAEIMIADFYAVCLDQVANHAAKLRYMSGGRTTVPLVIRGMQSGGLNFAAQHSQSIESWMIHVPGLKVAMPSTPADAKGILTVAIEDPDPVVIFEPVGLYGAAGMCPVGEHRVPRGSAQVVREGSDATVIAYGAEVPVALTAAEQLDGDGISVEVVDLRWLVPWDQVTVLESVRKTGRAVVAHQAVRRGGFGAEIAAVLQEELWGSLRAPVLRVAAANTPVPFATELEQEHLPNADAIAEAVRRTTKT